VSFIRLQSSDIMKRLKQFLKSSGKDDDEAAPEEGPESEPAPATETAPGAKPRLWIVDLPEQRFYELASSDSGADPLADGATARVRQLIDDFQNEKLEFKSLS
jgi:hypothetical protein